MLDTAAASYAPAARACGSANTPPAPEGERRPSRDAEDRRHGRRPREIRGTVVL